MKALTVRQPWAWAIAAGHKNVENRTHAWSHRGDLAIHAAASYSERGARSPLIHEALLGEDERWSSVISGGRLHRHALQEGRVLAVVRLADVHRAAPLGNYGATPCCESAWAETDYLHADGTLRRDVTHLVLADVRRLEVPVPAKGRLGLWDLPDDVERAVLEQMPPGEQEGCDCSDWCSMGPTCPGGYFAGLPGRGCDRSRL